MPIKKLRPLFTLTEDRLAELRAVVPEALADGKINWDTLREALGEHLEEAGQEHFGLSWPGKREARRLAAQPPQGTLLPQPGLGVNEESTHNLFIEGDNLEVLKLLLKSYAGRVKLIYIDPPYNTGNDFVYPDDYSEPLEAYLRRTGQADEAGQLLTTNTSASGRFHSNWLSMMYPRLLLARQLLCEDGIIAVSIDDVEIAHLKTLLSEIFGEENFVAHIVWQKRYVSNVTARLLSDMHDHILVYAGEADNIVVTKLPRTEDQLRAYRNPDNDPRGPWRAQDLSASKPYSAGLFTITTPAGLNADPPPGRYWRCNQDQYEKWLTDNRIWFGTSGKGRPMLKAFLSESQQGVTPNTWWSYEFAGHNKEATLEIKDLFDGLAVFDTAKPVKLIRRLLELFPSSDAETLVLDFFAGSCTSAHAVLEYNDSEKPAYRFIMVQLPEPIGTSTETEANAHRLGLRTVADVGRERIRRVITRMKAEDEGKMNLHPDEDLGFKSYRLARSNFKPWEPFGGEDLAALQLRFDEAETPLVEGWQPEHLLTEILLLQGFPLDSRVAQLPAFAHNRVLRVTSDLIAHHLTVCLDASLHEETLASLDLAAEDVFVCLDSALDDEAKLRLADRCNLRVI